MQQNIPVSFVHKLIAAARFAGHDLRVNYTKSRKSKDREEITVRYPPAT